jgi:hypothetical protein
MMTFKQWLRHRDQNPQPTQPPVPNALESGLTDQLSLESERIDTNSGKEVTHGYMD